MANPAFDVDEIGDEASASESSGSDEIGSESSESGASSSTDAETTTSDAETTEPDTTSVDTSDGPATSEESTSDSTDSTETGSNCKDSEIDCNGMCVDPSADEANCGECGFACDDGYVCVGTCELKNYVFVSSMVKTGVMGGIGGADALCNIWAETAGLPGSYYAWNSTEGSFPNFDFSKEGAYVRTDADETVVANSYADLISGTLLAAINIDENGNPGPIVPVFCNNGVAATWSNTTPSGNFAGPANCSNWTSIIGTGKIGNHLATDGTWSQYDGCNIPCATALPIYCVQQAP